MFTLKSYFVLATFAFWGCGTSDAPSSHLKSENFPLLAETAAAGGVTIEGVTLKNAPETSTDISPSSFPEKGGEISSIKIKFQAVLNVPSANKSFQYDKKHWAVAIGGPTQAPPRTVASGGVEVEDGGGLAGGGEKTALITLTLNFADKKLPDTWYERGIPETDSAQRQRLRFTPYYTTSGGGFSDSNSLIGIKEVYLTRETGSIKEGPSFGKATSRDSSITLEINPPSNTTAQAIVNNALVDVGQNSVNSYLVMYWDEEECLKSPKRTMKVNKTFDPAQTFSNQECTFVKQSDQAGGACILGCATNPESILYSATVEELAVPSVFPELGKTETMGCASVIRVGAGSQKSVGISGLKNGKTYGAVAWAVDGGGSLSKGRSSCISFVPKEVSLASLEKSPHTRKTKEDCFVATAASGNLNSDAVHYWRVLRDRYLTQWGFTSFYYKYAQEWASQVENHPSLKRPLSEFLGWSGRVFVTLDDWWRSWQFRPLDLLQDWLISSAEAQSAVGKDSEFSPIDVPAKNDSATPKDSSTGDGSQQEEESGSVPGSASGGIWLMGGNFTATEDTKIYHKYYPKRAYYFELGEYWRLAEAQGELSLGGAIGLGFTNGSIPKTQEFDPDVQGRKILYFTQSFMAVGSYRFRMEPHPWVAPRVSLGLGALRFREEEQAEPKDKDTKKATLPKIDNATETETKKTDNTTIGVTHWKPIAQLRLEAEISLGNFMKMSGDNPNYSYGLEDFMLTLGVTYRKDFSKTISQTGYMLHGGLNLLFL